MHRLPWSHDPVRDTCIEFDTRLAERNGLWILSKVDPDRPTRLLQRPVEERYDVREVDVELPAPARVFTSVGCASCGEPTMETRVRRLAGEQLCQPCFEQRLAAT